MGATLYFYGKTVGVYMLMYGFFFVALIAILWWRDVVREGTFEGKHTSVVQKGLKLGMILFILSEVMFFVSFFWAFFNFALAPSIQFGGIWPPYGISVFNYADIPLLNTLILLLSGVFVTWTHNEILSRKTQNQFKAVFSLVMTIILAALFTMLQGLEYVEASFSMSDSTYGSIFFLATGFHGLHVIIGTIFLAVCLGRLLKYHFTRNHHLGLEFAIWYWHFVDVVWLFLYLAVYWWSGLSVTVSSTGI